MDAVVRDFRKKFLELYKEEKSRNFFDLGILNKYSERKPQIFNRRFF